MLGDTPMSDYAYLLIAVGLGLAALVAVYLVQRRRVAAGDSKHSWVSYLLVWPLILHADQSKRDGKILTGREWVGWGIVLLVAVLAISFT
jgi:hypothetical protein